MHDVICRQPVILDHRLRQHLLRLEQREAAQRTQEPVAVLIRELDRHGLRATDIACNVIEERTEFGGARSGQGHDRNEPAHGLVQLECGARENECAPAAAELCSDLLQAVHDQLVRCQAIERGEQVKRSHVGADDMRECLRRILCIVHAIRLSVTAQPARARPGEERQGQPLRHVAQQQRRALLLGRVDVDDTVAGPDEQLDIGEGFAREHVFLSSRQRDGARTVFNGMMRVSP